MDGRRPRDVPSRPLVLVVDDHDDTRELVRERAQHEGCAGFFVKPCLPDELATELRHVLERAVGDERVSTPL